MVMNMTDKKDPDQENIPVDFDDDDDVIELTNEVIIKPKNEEDDTDLQDTAKDVPETPVEKSISTDEPEPESGDDGGIFNLDRTPGDESGAEETVLDLDKAFAGDDPALSEDEIIASAIAEALGPDDEEPSDDRINLSEAADTGTENDDDVIIMNQDDDEPAGVSERTAGTDDLYGEEFDTEEEIELEYESTEDEYDFFATDDKEAIEELETITMADDETDGIAEIEMPFDPLADLNLDSTDDDEIIAMEADSHAEPDLMAFDDDDDETLEFEGTENLPDMTDEMEFELAEDLPDVTDELEFEDDDDLPDLKDEVEFEGVDDLPDLKDEVEFEEPDGLPDLTDEVEYEEPDDLPDLTDEVEFEAPDDLPDLTDEVEFEGAGDLPDLTAEMDFELDDDDAEGEPTAPDDQIAENSDDIIARSIETSLAADEVTSQIDLAMEPEFEFAQDSDMADEEGEAESEADFTAKTKEELRALAEADDLSDFGDDFDLEFENEEDGSDVEDNGDLEFEDESEVTDIEDSGDLESEMEVLAIEDLEDSSAEEEADIIEITEFDEHFPEEEEKKLERAGVLDASNSDEDDFLELIEVEEDGLGLVADEEVIEFDSTEDKIDEDEIDSFFSDSLEDEPVLENEEDSAVEGTPAMSTDMAMATASTADEDDEFDFSFDSSDISQQVDRLDTFLSDDPTPEPAVASLPGEDEVPETEENMLGDDQEAEEEADEPLPVSSDQINAILESAIKEKFGGKIENVIYEVIAKAVSKEIDRLKDALLDTGEPGGSSDENE